MRASLLAFVLLAGCASMAHDHGGGLDTGEIAPGASARLTFLETGATTIHCHPHPWMEQTVTVVAGGEPSEFTVEILDGNATEDYRFEPAALEVPAASTVVYVNRGTLVHTATQGSEE